MRILFNEKNLNVKYWNEVRIKIAYKFEDEIGNFVNCK